MLLLLSIRLDLPESFSEGLLANRILTNTEHLYRNEIRGPESFAIWQGRIFTSLADGRIVEVLRTSLKTIAFIDPNNMGLEACQKPWIATLGNCSRPLGLRFDSKGNLYTVDPYHGIYKIDIATGKYDLIMDIQKHLLPDGTVAGFLDDLVLDEKSNGHLVFYLSLASTKWALHDCFYTVGEFDQTGQLLSFDTQTQRLTVEVKDLAFPNGLEWTDDKSAILLNELSKRTIHKYHLQGSNKGKLTVLASNLPGEPDNIKRSADPNRETYLVGLFMGRNKHNPSLFDKVTDKPILRRFSFRLQRAIGNIIHIIGEMSECEFLISLGFEIKVGNKMSDDSAKHYGLMIEIDANGKIINSFHDPTGQSSGFSELHEIQNTETERHFLLGSFQGHYLGRLVVKKCQLQNNDIKTPDSDKPTTRKVIIEEKKDKSTSSGTSTPKQTEKNTATKTTTTSNTNDKTKKETKSKVDQHTEL